MLSIFKAFDQMLESYKFNLQAYSTNPVDLFKDIEHEKTEEEGSNETSTWKTEKWSSSTGNVTFYKKVIKFKPKETKEPSIEDLKNLLNKAIEEERFEDAIKLRDQIKNKKEV